MNSIETLTINPPTRFSVDMEIFSTQEGIIGTNLYTIGLTPFLLEQELRHRDVDEIILTLYNSEQYKIDYHKLEKIIEELIYLVLLKEVKCNIQTTNFISLGKSKIDQPKRVKSICLFSGGVDSYSGILLAKKYYPDITAVFCAHSDQAHMINISQSMSNTVLKKNGITTWKINVPRIHALGFSHMRGFLYFLSAAAVLSVVNADNIIITEVGPTMYQPRFTQFDDVTMTTHPYVIELSNKMIETVLGREINYILPFENCTKAEVVSLSPEKIGFQKTHSCISQRFGTHDGTCYGCIMRRLAFIVAGVVDVNYKRNPILNESDNFIYLNALLRYSEVILTNFKNMEYYQIENIENYNKYDLFKRFSLDNFSAIRTLLLDKKPIINPIKEIYFQTIELIGTDILDERIHHLRNGEIENGFIGK